MNRLAMVLLLLLLLPSAPPASTYGDSGEQNVVGAGDPRVVVGPGPGPSNPPIVRVFPPEDGAPPLLEFMAYGIDQYGINVSCGDLDGDLLDEIITGAGPGAVFGPHVRGWRGDGTPVPEVNFFAYGTHKYGVNVAAGDLDGDGIDEIVTGAGPGAVFGPHVRGWNVDGGDASAIPSVSFLAYGTPKWGVNVSCGDIDGDGFDEIVTGAGPGGVYGPHVRGWNYDGSGVMAFPGVSFLAYGTHMYGINVSCGDIDGDDIDEILTMPGPGSMFGPHIRGWNVDGGTATSISGLSFFAFQSLYGGKVFSGVDLDGDGLDEIIAGPGPDPGMGAHARGYSYSGGSIYLEFTLEAFEDLYYGANVAAGNF